MVSLAELHRRRGLTLFQLFWEQGITCGQSCSAVIVWFPSISESDWKMQYSQPIIHFGITIRMTLSHTNTFGRWVEALNGMIRFGTTTMMKKLSSLNLGNRSPVFWNEDGSLSERVFGLFFDSIPKDAEYIAATISVTTSSYNACHHRAIFAIRKQNQYRSEKVNFKIP